MPQPEASSAPADANNEAGEGFSGSKTFAELGVDSAICEAIEAVGWSAPSKIQQQAIPHGLEGKDIIGLAETGSGKTGAFVIPILQSLLQNPQRLYALVLAPTRELAYQIGEQFEALGASIGLKCACVVGGIDMMQQQVALARKPHVVIATPGRLVDHLENTKGFSLRTMKFLVLDEADRMLSMDFEEEINQIVQLMPAERNTYLFSATMTSKVRKLQRASLKDPVKVEITHKFATPETLKQHYLFIPAKFKDCYLAYVLNEVAGQSVLIFASTCNGTQKVTLMLRNLGFQAICLHGQMPQPSRLGALNKFKAKARNVLVCTDVASRGLDIPSVDVVINYDIPTHGKDYIHRVGKHVMSAYVEIIFDNSDGRLPVDDTEVTLRRTIGVKKDEFFLNRKHIPKSDVVHLLESAGFSRSNPYYIVQQGKVNALAVMRERERLELLKEVAGTKVYEDQRVKSLKILQETQTKRDKIQEVVSYIEERLSELEEEKEELKEYQQLDKEQRALEYTMHEKELQSVRAEMEAVEKQRQKESALTKNLHEKLMHIRAEVSRIESDQHGKKQDLVQLVEERKVREDERKGLMEARYKLETEVEELKEQIRTDGMQRSAVSKEVEDVKRKIEEKRAQLDSEILPALRQAEQTYDQVTRNLQECRAQSDHLIAKQSRKSQFLTQQQRDDYLQREISDIEGLVRRKEADTASLRYSIEGLAKSIEGSERTLQQHVEELHEHRRRVDAVGTEVLRLKEQRNRLNEERKEKWREENQISYNVRELKKKLSDGEHALQSTMAYDVRRGLQAVREMQGRIRGIYGPLIDLVRPVDERYCIAADEAAGGALFHVVVDTDDTAARIMRELDRKNLGRLTFLPLNRLKVKEHFDYPRNDDVVALVEKMEYPAEVRKGVMAAFGKKLLCRDLETCVRYAEQTNMDCLTLDGDMVHRRGALNGGFKDPRRSRTRAMMEVKQAQVDLESVMDRAQRVKTEAQQADQRVTGIISEIQKLESEKHNAISAHERLYDEISRRKNHIRMEKDILLQRERSCELQEREVKDLVAKITSLRSELLTPMQDTLTADEEKLLHSLSAKISLFEAEERDQKLRLEEIRAKKKSIETVLEENLVRRENELAQQLGEGVEELVISEREESLKAKQIDLDDASRLVDDNTSTLKELEQKIAELQQEIANEKAQADALNGEDVSLSDQIEQEARRAEKVLNKHRRLLKKSEDVTRDIQELGTLPITELEKFKDLSYQDVIKQFKRRNEKLKKYSHVNKKALDQFISFNEQRSTLLERKREIDDAYNSIKDLIDVLDKRKDEAIFRTFKGVASFFSEVFRELVPTGEGKMILVGADTSQPRNANGGDVSLQSNVDTYSGVQIKVNFRGEGDSYLMQQLSGGQKALVALAFIFAIQRVDPAPFYLFDEIDQALDSTHRAAVAALIHRQAQSKDSPAQFITSTFRPELVNIADKFYGIGYQNKISNVYAMSKEESLDFISNIMAEEEGVEGS